MEPISTFDIFKIGVGPSSSHTLGPWRAAEQFVNQLNVRELLNRVTRVQVDLFGSLAKTGHGHGTDLAVVLGLAGEDPVTCDTTQLHTKVEAVRTSGRIALGDGKVVAFHPARDIVFHTHTTLPFHPNGLTFTATLDDLSEFAETYYSVGGGFVVQEAAVNENRSVAVPPFPIETSADLLRHCREQRLTIPELIRRNERAWRTESQISEGLIRLADEMRACAFRGCQVDGILPGGLNVVRRAGRISRARLGERPCATVGDWLTAVSRSSSGFREILDWVSCFALAVNEENAAFGRVVTAPTNGAAGVIPAVLLYLDCFANPRGQHAEEFLLTAGVVGGLFKQGATISAALGGCQAEIGVSSAMAAAGLAQCLGGTAGQSLMAAEIAMEHHLGLTCDPVGGLVQVPCIERNTMGAIKAITAAQLALAGDPTAAKVSLDAVIRSMWETAQDMNTKYKETAEGGLALQIAVNVAEC